MKLSWTTWLVVVLLLFGCEGKSENQDDPSSPQEKKNQKIKEDKKQNPGEKKGKEKRKEEEEKVTYPGWLGVAISYNGPKKNPRPGVRVVKVIEGSPAAKKGIQRGHIILSLNGKKIRDPIHFFQVLSKYTARDQISLEAFSPAGNKQFSLQIALSAPSQKIIDGALQRAVKWLVSRQRKDGGWQHFASAKKRSSAPMTALVVAALASCPKLSESAEKSLDRGLEFLLKEKTKSGLLGDTGDIVKMETYTTPLALVAMIKRDRKKYAREIDRLSQKLLKAQIDKRAGFSEYDYQFGAWNYWPGKDQNTMRADISVASHVLEALSLNGLKADSETVKKALHFIKQCQNYDEKTKGNHPLLDGGFHFSPLESKAGIITENGKDYFRSYGSSTADGLRTLLYCGYTKDHPRVQAAIQWLSKNYSLRKNPGFPDDSPVTFDRAIRYYYYASFARALAKLKIKMLKTPQGKRAWPVKMVSRLLLQQRWAGYWKNRANIMHEDHPELATSLVILAFSHLYPLLPSGQ